jgi:hypothetical protein
MQAETSQPQSPYLERFQSMDYYEVLDIPKDSSFDAIGLAYRRALQMYDPLSVAIYSILTPEEARAMSELVEKAYKVLRDPVDRRKYDKDLELAPAVQAAAELQIQIAARATVPPGPVQRSFSFLAPVYAVEQLSEAGTPAIVATDLPMKTDDAAFPPEPLTGVPPVIETAPSIAAETPPVEMASQRSQPPAEAAPPSADRTSPLQPPVVDVMLGNVPSCETEPVERTDQAVQSEKPQQAGQPVGALKSGIEKSWFLQSRPPDRDITDLPAADLEDVPPVKSEPPAPAKAAEKPAPDAPVAVPQENDGEIQIGPETVFTGPVLRKIRKKQGLDLGDIAAITRVTKANLQFIEDETYKELPALVYVRGYLGLFARCLKLDPKRVASTYIQRMQDSGPDGMKE